MRVLVAEDNEVNQLVLQGFLEQTGWEVVMTANGQQALEAFRQERFDAVLLDCHMPVLDGLDAARAMRALEQARAVAATPIIAVTANAMREERATCLAAGFDDYLSKPFAGKELIDLVRRHLKG